MTLDCYDFDAGQPRHFPAGTYNRQMEEVSGRQALDVMRLVWRCWVVFKLRNEGTWKDEDVQFAEWVAIG